MTIPNVQNTSNATYHNNSGNAANTQNNQQTAVPVGKKIELKKDVKDFIEQYALLHGVEDPSTLIEKLEAKGIDANTLDIIALEKALQEIITNTDEVDASGSEETKTEAENVSNKPDNTVFNHKEYSTKSVEEKVQILIEELAENEFIYGNKPENFDSMSSEEKQKWIEEQKNKWNSLSDEQRKSYINDKKENLNQMIIKLVSDKTGKDTDKISIENIQKFLTDVLGKENIEKDLTQLMTMVQVANKKNLCTNELKSLKKEQISEIVHDYIFEMKVDSPDLLSEEQQDYIEESILMTSAVINHAKNNGSSIGNIDEGSAFSFAEIDNYISDNNTTRIKIKLDYLQEKQKNGTIKDDEKVKLANLQNLDKALETVNGLPQENYGRLEELRASKAGKLWGDSTKSKVNSLRGYLNNIKNLSPEEYAKVVLEMGRELQSDQATQELGSMFIGMALENATDEQKNAISNSNNKRDMTYNALNLNNFDEKSAQNVSEIQKKEQNAVLAHVSLNNADEIHLNVCKNSYSSFGIDEVEQHLGDVTLDQSRVGIESQADILDAIERNSSLNVRKNIGARLYKAYKENQVSATQKFMEDKEVAIYMNEQDNLHKYHKDNQTKIFDIYKNRFEQNDFSQDEAISNLNHLSDQIKDCDPSNQLDMHKSIMNSQYEEVQTHAAGNIKNYDSSVQADALDAVYATGNPKAIETAVTDIPSYKSTDVQQQEYPRTVCETVIQNANEEEFQEKLLSGNLSYQEIAQLTPTQRREYYAEIYKKASATEKIALISKLPNGVQKKTIYTLIALYDQNLLSQMVEQGMGLDMFKACNDVKAQNKIISVMKSSENQTVKEQYREIVADPRNAGLFIGEDFSKTEPKTAKTLNYASIPEGFDKKELFLKDKNGYLLG